MTGVFADRDGGVATAREAEGLPSMRGCKTAAIVVTYNPAPTLPANIAILRAQVQEVIIVDNGSDKVVQEMIAEAASPPGCRAILSGRNLGVAAALNLGMAAATDKQCDLVLLLDQDSIVTSSFVKDIETSYLTAVTRYNSGIRHLGMVVPNYVDNRSGAAMPLTRYRDGSVLTGMTSGSLLPMTTYRQCGPFDEGFFIDYVDIEYCLRLRDHGFSVMQSQNAVLLHSLGTLQAHRIAGLSFSATNHSAGRRYYISRNRTILFLRYIVKRPGWVARDLWAMAMETGKIVLVEDDRLKKLGYSIRGVFDGLLGRSGYRVKL